MINKEVIKKFGVVYFAAMFLLIIGSFIGVAIYENNKIQDFSISTAIVTKVGQVGASCNVNYRCFVNGKHYQTSQQISSEVHRRVKDKEIRRISNLKIKYARDAPSISKIIDDRVKSL